MTTDHLECQICHTVTVPKVVAIHSQPNTTKHRATVLNNDNERSEQ